MSEEKQLPEWWPEFEKAMRSLTELPENWNSYNSLTPSSLAVEQGIETIRKIVKPSWPMPRIGPTAPGGCQVEWNTKEVAAEIEFVPTIAVAVLFEDRKNGEEEWEEEDIGYDLDIIEKFLDPLLGEESVGED